MILSCLKLFSISFANSVTHSPTQYFSKITVFIYRRHPIKNPFDPLFYTSSRNNEKKLKNRRLLAKLDINYLCLRQGCHCLHTAMTNITRLADFHIQISLCQCYKEYIIPDIVSSNMVSRSNTFTSHLHAQPAVL